MKKVANLLMTLFLGALLSGSSCLDPCRQVADKVCSCEATEPDKQACRRQVEVQAAQRPPKPEQRVQCQRFMTTCECRELRAGNLAACGLARE